MGVFMLNKEFSLRDLSGLIHLPRIQWAVPATPKWGFSIFFPQLRSMRDTVGSPRNSGVYSFLPLLRNLVDTNKHSGQSLQLKQWAVPTTVEFILFYHCYAIFLFFYTVGSPHNAKWVFSFLPRNHDSGIDSPTTIGLRPPHQKLTAACKKCLLLPTTRPARFQP